MTEKKTMELEELGNQDLHVDVPAHQACQEGDQHLVADEQDNAQVAVSQLPHQQLQSQGVYRVHLITLYI